MSAPNAPLFLASSSPQRAQVLNNMGFDFTVLDAAWCAVDETALPDELPAALVARLALAKAQKGLEAPLIPANGLVLSGDTVVAHAGSILGKPADDNDAWQMLNQLQGRSHEVLTAIAVANRQTSRVVTVTTTVHFAPLTPLQIDAYIATGEPKGKAGGYAIQGIAAQFVQAIHGSWGAVVGLPHFETAQLLAAFAQKPRWLTA